MHETKVITVTLSPSLDRTLVTHYLAVGYHNRTKETTRLDPGGRSVNVARGLHQLESPVHAVILLGDDATGRAYEALVRDEGFAMTVMQVTGVTRSNTIILDRANDTETQIIEEAAEISEGDLEQVENVLQTLIAPGDIVVLAGSLPPGAPADTYRRLTDTAQEAGAEVATIIGGEPLEYALKAQPELIGVKQIEVEAIFNYPIRQLQDVVGAGRELVNRGAGKVLIAIEELNAAVLVMEEEAWIAELPVPKGEQGTTVGVWSAMLAGFIGQRIANGSDVEALRLAAAAAAYTASQVGSEFATREAVQPFMDQTEARQVELQLPSLPTETPAE